MEVFGTLKKILGRYDTVESAIEYSAWLLGLGPFFTAAGSILYYRFFDFIYWMEWLGVYVAVVVLYYGIKIILNSKYLLFKEDSFEEYKYYFSKKPRRVVPYEDIARVEITNGAVVRNREIQYSDRKNYIILHSGTVLVYQINRKLAYRLYKLLGEDRVSVCNENHVLTTFSDVYQIKFEALTEDQKMEVIEYYCRAFSNFIQERKFRKFLEEIRKEQAEGLGGAGKEISEERLKGDR